MPLKPFAYPLPETRFLHAGGIVYKFKIRYGNLQSAPELNNTEIAVKEFEEAIRVILGNLDDLHPFSTDHFTIFPYLSKWERVSEMRFEHKNVDLVPYPYICTMYLELNSFQQSLSLGKEVNSDTSEPVKRKSEIPETTEMEEMVKRRRTEGQMETSYPVLCMDRIMPKKFSVSIIHHPSAWAASKRVYGDLWEITWNKEQNPASLRVERGYCNQWTKSQPKELRSLNQELSQSSGEGCYLRCSTSSVGSTELCRDQPAPTANTALCSLFPPASQMLRVQFPICKYPQRRCCFTNKELRSLHLCSSAF
ncbi:membrane-anchored junction protein isoform X1 [Coturnix japonica]|uniref:membrane-anchored junction protein isoform X1 n=2 Tax=Coturnix japonica TaxID=93934 RepID=UPI00077801BA|nr:membrane-anchored junction protein isoform X1 [Coturnix japonica]